MKAKPIEMFDPGFLASCKKKPKPKFKLGQMVETRRYDGRKLVGMVVAIDMYMDFDKSYSFSYSVGGNGSRWDAYQAELSPAQEENQGEENDGTKKKDQEQNQQQH